MEIKHMENITQMPSNRGTRKTVERSIPAILLKCRLVETNTT